MPIFLIKLNFGKKDQNPYTKRGVFVCLSVCPCVDMGPVFGAKEKARPVLEMAGPWARHYTAGILSFLKNRVAIFKNGCFF